MKTLRLVIFLTAMSETGDEKKGYDLGAVDYITKPISPPIVLARVKTHLQLKAGADFLKDKNAYLQSEVFRRTREVQAIQDVTIFTMASLAETASEAEVARAKAQLKSGMLMGLERDRQS